MPRWGLLVLPLSEDWPLLNDCRSWTLLKTGRVNARGRAIRARRDEIENARDRGAIRLNASGSGRRVAVVAIAGFCKLWSGDLYCDKES